MKVFGKDISASFHFTQSGEELLFGVNVVPGECECCGEPVTVTRIGIGIVELNVFVQ